MTTKAELDIGGTRLELSNLDKVFYPEVGFTKAQVVDYYMRIARKYQLFCVRVDFLLVNS